MLSRLLSKAATAFFTAALGLAACGVATPLRAAEKTKALQAGDVVSGSLTAMRSGPKKARIIVYQLTSEPRRLPAPNGLCNLETGPETFQIVTSNDAEVSALKPLIGKNVSIKANEMSCAQAAGQMSDALITKWSVVKQ